MLDQAYDLRRLTMQHSGPASPDAGQRPALLAVAGGKGGVGTTTAAVKLAEALTQAGQRTLLIDADPRGGNAAMLCGIEERYSLADVLSGRRRLADAVETAVSGLRLMAGIAGPRNSGKDRRPRPSD